MRCWTAACPFLLKVEASVAETPGGGACDDEASEAVGSDSAGEGIPEDGRCARVASKGQGRGTGLCSGTW